MVSDRTKGRVPGWSARFATAGFGVAILLGAISPLSTARADSVSDLTGVTATPTTAVTIPGALPAITVPLVTGTIVPPKVELAPTIPPAVETGGEVTTPTGVSGSPIPPPSAGATSTAPTGPVATRPAAEAADANLRPAAPTVRRAGEPSRAVSARLRQAAAETVQQLSFPLGLALAMLGFLVFQHRLDKGDARVEAALESGDDDLLRFS